MAIKKVYTLATEEYVNNVIEQLKNEFPNKKFNGLKTEDKTIIGGINEVHSLLNMFLVPEYDVTAQMFYGVIDPNEVGFIESFRDITFDMINNTGNVSTKPGERSVSVGYVEQGKFIFIAIPVIFDLIAAKDDGFGGVMAFDESVVGANGVDIVLNGQDYLIYGEFVVVDGERKIHITTRNPIDIGCQCPPITDDDISNIINDL